MKIHPKTSGTALGTAIGVLIVAVLQSFHSIHLSPELPAAITGFCGILGSWVVPTDSTPPSQGPNISAS